MAAIIQSNIMGRQLKIFTIRLHKNNPEITPDPTLEYLKNFIFTLMVRLFSTPFTYDSYGTRYSNDDYYIRFIN